MSIDIAKLREAGNAATSAPWTFTDEGNWQLEMSDKGCQMCDEQYYPWTPDREEDWNFMEVARNNWDALLDRIEELEKEAACNSK